MRVLLLKDVYKLGRAGDVKKVADGYGRNYLLPHRAGRAGHARRAQAGRAHPPLGHRDARPPQSGAGRHRRTPRTGCSWSSRSRPARPASSTARSRPACWPRRSEQATGAQVDKRQIDCQPIKALGVHKASLRLTIDLVPSLTIVVHREGELAELAFAETAAAQIARARGRGLRRAVGGSRRPPRRPRKRPSARRARAKRGEDAEADETAEA